MNTYSTLLDKDIADKDFADKGTASEDIEIGVECAFPFLFPDADQQEHSRSAAADSDGDATDGGAVDAGCAADWA